MERRFGGWLASQLAMRDMTQAELARKMETSTGAVSSWVHNTRTPTPASCREIARVLRVPVDMVLTAAGHRPSDNGAWPQEILEVAEMMKQLPDEQRAEVVAFVRWRLERSAGDA